MRRLRHKCCSVLAGLSLILICLFIWRRSRDEQRDFIPKRSITLVIVDEHQHVIPYWVREIELGKIPKSGNTLIHIDAHADAGYPIDISETRKVSITLGSHHNRDSLFELMRSNDRFIVSAAAAGIIDSLVWILPTFSETEIADDSIRSFESIGMSGSKKEDMCMCTTRSNNGSNFCVSDVDRDDVLGYLKIPSRKCTNRIPLRFEMWLEESISELIAKDWFVDLIGRHVILDIDLDYFGVSTASAKLIEMISPSDLDTINDHVGNIFCPQSAVQEANSDGVMQEALDELIAVIATLTGAKERKRAREKWASALVERIPKNARCRGDDGKKSGAHEWITTMKLASLLFTYERQQVELLKRGRFCRTSGEEFGLCVGALPWSQQSHYRRPDANGIAKRAQNLLPLLRRLFASLPGPQIITVARSIRDGYTSRESFQQIEDALLNTLTQTARDAQIELLIKYDDDLLYGKEGWSEGK